MYKVGDYVVYKRDVCRIVELKDINNQSCYVLNPIDDETLKITTNISNSQIRNLINKEACEKLIELIPSIDIIKSDDKNLENEYKKLLLSGDLKDLIKIIKTTYLRNQNRLSSHKKIGEKDDNYFKKAEKLLYNEMSISLGLTYDETKDYIKNKVESLIK